MTISHCDPGIILTPEQSQVVSQILKGLDRQRVQTLGGAAGTGKSVVVQHLSERLPKFGVCAFTGKAAHVLRQRGVRASTIHSLIYTTDKKSKGAPTFKLKEKADLPCHGFIVDEASMISDVLHRDLRSFGLPVIYVGDHHQLPPVGTDINLMSNPDYRLVHLHRNAGEIACFAQHLREGRPAKEFRCENQVVILRRDALPVEALLSVDVVIAGTNSTRVAMNRYIRGLLKFGEQVEVNDRVICLRNNRAKKLYNGLMGTVTAVEWGDSPRFDLDSGGEVIRNVWFDPSQFNKEKLETPMNGPNPFDYAYCLTAHKAQGDEWDKVLVVEQHFKGWGQHKGWDQRRWNYTAASRARKHLYWIAYEPRTDKEPPS
jgi:exodeoxyribonuclease-5